MEQQAAVSETLKVRCYHCGEKCENEVVSFDEKSFCCDGCKLVYDLLKENNLCNYYQLNHSPGISPLKSSNSSKYAYLDNEEVSKKLIRYQDETCTHINFYVPKVHCTSCIWLLENLHTLNDAIISSTVHFLRKEVTLVFNHKRIKLSDAVALMAHIGYEPLINLSDLEPTRLPKQNRTQLLKIGLAGFCFGNIMMLSFPEYFSSGDFQEQHRLSYLFGYLNLFLSLPVFFYCANEFFISAWKSIREHYLTLDAPIALAIFITFIRSVYEITSHTGAGYMDSMSGIVFFMLIGRYFQNRTYDTLSFERDYKSYFPVGVTLKKDNVEENIPVLDLKKSDRIIIRNNELIPADSILINAQTHIDYSFITGESEPVKKVSGDFIYAGGKQLEGAIELEVVNPTSQSYLTQLWNQENKQSASDTRSSYVNSINKYFTIFVLSTSFISAMYWLLMDSNKALNALTAVLIVACPCGLLLTTTFANGNIVRILGLNKIYLKNSDVLEKVMQTDTILFDKTGTITHGSEVSFVGPKLSDYHLHLITSLAAQSAHPLSRNIYTQFNQGIHKRVERFEEYVGKGIKGQVDDKYIVLGSELFVVGTVKSDTNTHTKVFISIDGFVAGYFSFANSYRPGLKALIATLAKNYHLKVASGDNDSERQTIKELFGSNSEVYFNQKPDDKMRLVEKIQSQNHKVMMIGDGLNDAGALKQSNVGIAVSDNTNTFSPACDVIMDGAALAKLPLFIQLAKAGKKVVIGTFVISLIYNVAGLYFAVQGILSPVIAAILMPLSSITIVLLATVSTTLISKWYKLDV